MKVNVLDELFVQKPDCIIVHPGFDDITKSINILNAIKKLERKSKFFSKLQN